MKVCNLSCLVFKSSFRGANEGLNLIIPMTVLFFFSNVILTSKNDQSNRDLLGRITLYTIAQSVSNKKILSTTKIHL